MELGYSSHEPHFDVDTAGVIKSLPRKRPQRWHWDDLQDEAKAAGFIENNDERTLISFIGLSDDCKLDVRPSSNAFKSYDCLSYGKGDMIYLPITREHRGCGTYHQDNYRFYIAQHHLARPRKLVKLQSIETAFDPNQKKPNKSRDSAKKL
jgi:hypothetical protein